MLSDSAVNGDSDADSATIHNRHTHTLTQSKPRAQSASQTEKERESSHCVGVLSIFNESFVKFTFTITDAACIHNNIVSQCHAAFMRPINTYFNSLRPGQRTPSVNEQGREREG